MERDRKRWVGGGIGSLIDIGGCMGRDRGREREKERRKKGGWWIRR